MLEHDSNNDQGDQRLSESTDRANKEETFLQIHRLELKKKRGNKLVGIDIGVEISREPPAVVRIPAKATWCALGAAARALGLELVIDTRD